MSVESIESWEFFSGDGRLWDWSKSLGEDVSDVHTEVFEIGAGNVSGDLTDIGFKSGNVGHSVSEDSLEELAWVVEDGRPCLDSLGIVFHSFAVGDVGLDNL